MRQRQQQSKSNDFTAKLKANDAKYRLLEENLNKIGNENDLLWNEINDLHEKMPQEKIQDSSKFLERQHLPPKIQDL